MTSDPAQCLLEKVAFLKLPSCAHLLLPNVKKGFRKQWYLTVELLQWVETTSHCTLSAKVRPYNDPGMNTIFDQIWTIIKKHVPEADDL